MPCALSAKYRMVQVTRGGFRGRGRGGPRGGDKRDWRERRAEDQKNGFGKPQGEQRREVQKDAR